MHACNQIKCTKAGLQSLLTVECLYRLMLLHQISAMDSSAQAQPANACHVVAMPYPGRGHINPMMNLCKLMTSKRPDILFTFVVTEAWLGFIGSEDKPANVRFETVPNVIPSELVRAKIFPAFLEAVQSKMEAPFEELLDRLDPPVSVIIADTFLAWMPGVGNRRNIPVASLWTMSATVLSVFLHLDLLRQNKHFPAQLSERGEEIVDYIPGVPPSRLADFTTILFGNEEKPLNWFIKYVSGIANTQFLLFNSVYELESSVIDALAAKSSVQIYPLGPTIPYLDQQDHCSANYLHWLDSQPNDSVLYVSMGSFLSLSTTQMDEIAAGVHTSRVRFLWVSRDESALFENGCGDMGVVVPWCDQLRVLRHPAVGGFWTHCGWNSTLEAVFAGVPMLTSPIFLDQVPDSKMIVEDWKVGWRVLKRKVGDEEDLATRQEISELVQRFMDGENIEVQEMRKRARELQKVCQEAIAEGGSSDCNLDSFIKNIVQEQTK